MFAFIYFFLHKQGPNIAHPLEKLFHIMKSKEIKINWNCLKKNTLC